MKKLLPIFLVIISIFCIISCKKDKIEYDIKLDDDIIGNNVVLNYSNAPYLDNIILIGLNELKIDSVNVIIYTMPRHLQFYHTDEKIFIIDATITRILDGSYVIYVNDNTIQKNTTLKMSHELIHLKQYNDYRLIIPIYSESLIIFDNVEYKPQFLEYGDRPWEIEAFENQSILSKKIESKLLDLQS